MKKLLIKTSLFFVLLFLFSFLLWICFHTDKPIIKIKEKVLILGDSHTQDAVNDAIFTNSYNYSLSGEPFINSYVKLVNIASASKIDTLILSVSPVKFNNKIQKFPGGGANKLLFHFPLRDLKFLLQHNNPLLFLKPLGFFRPNFHKVGGYRYSSQFDLQADINRFSSNSRIPCTLQEAQLLYLDKIVEYCKSKSIKLIFINTPMYHAERFYNMDNFYKIIEKKYNDVTFWDYGDYILPDSCYGDVGHLNYIGADMFSAMLQEKVRSKINQ